MRKHSGFSLIELLIVIAIIGILAAIAIPNYNEYIIKGKITEAVAGLSSMRTKMEQYFQDNRTYVGGCTAAGTNGLSDLPPNTSNFTFSCTTTCGGATTSLAAAAYVVRACGQGSMTGFEYTIDQANNRATVSLGSGWAGAPATCWITSKGGGC